MKNKLKTDSHNTITIKEVKERIYTEAELKEIIKNFSKTFVLGAHQPFVDKSIDNWMINNLK